MRDAFCDDCVGRRDDAAVETRDRRGRLEAMAALSIGGRSYVGESGGKMYMPLFKGEVRMARKVAGGRALPHWD
jgi:hypothetical protein